MSKSNDRGLRFYHEVLGLDRLHYGIWEKEDKLTFENCTKAQIRYEDYLIDNIPDGVRTVLDVGCGTGILVNRLLSKDYKADGLSPDIYQKEVFKDHNPGATFHHSAFEDFHSQEQYDCVIMSESCQYINITEVFKHSEKIVKPGGYLMICDYFVFDDASGAMAKSGHNYSEFLAQNKKSTFEIVIDKDITDSVLKTLDLANLLVDRILKGIDIGTEKVRSKYPSILRLFKLLFKKKLKKINSQRDLIDSRLFKENKAYRFLLFKNGENK